MDYSIFEELEPFNHVEINSSFDIFLYEGDTYSIEIIGNEEIIEHVSFNVINNVLKIDDNRKIKWTTPKKNKIEIYINSEPLTEVKINEACNTQTINPITSEEFGLILCGKVNIANLELNCNTFYFWNNFPCGGKLTLSGETEKLRIWNDALFVVDSKELLVNHALIENRSKGDCDVTVLNELEYSIQGSGNIHLYGSPTNIIEGEITSSGKLIKH